jgi:hypothetical protein
MSNVLIESHTKIPLTLPNGQQVQMQPPSRAQALVWLRRLAAINDGDLLAMTALVEQFPDLADHPKAFDDLLPMEIATVATGFFYHSRTAANGKAAPSPGPATT